MAGSGVMSDEEQPVQARRGLDAQTSGMVGELLRSQA